MGLGSVVGFVFNVHDALCELFMLDLGEENSFGPVEGIRKIKRGGFILYLCVHFLFSFFFRRKQLLFLNVLWGFVF